jgi:hypothetical protein
MPEHIVSRLLLSLLALPAVATVHLSTGEYRSSAVDMRVKIPGGEVVIQSTWQPDDLNKDGYRWHPSLSGTICALR